MARRPKSDAVTEDETRPLYSAPALEKGLDILELLARERHPLTASAIVQKLGRSTGELFRMILVLERRGFVAQGPEGYALTSRLFEMGLDRPPLRNLVEIALPIMRDLSTATGQSCHLAFPSLGEMIVVARMESRAEIGFTVRVGYRQPLHLTTSGATLYAFQPPEIRSEWEKVFQPRLKQAELSAFRAKCDAIRAQGHAELASGFIDGLLDLSAPILRGDRAAAAIAVPFVHSKGAAISKAEVIAALREAAAAIMAELVLSDNRV